MKVVQNNPSWRNTFPQIINEILSYILLIHQRIHNIAPDAKLLAFVYFSVISGPTERTVDDFWLMIWEQNPSGIVMVTKVFEMTKVTATKISESETRNNYVQNPTTVIMICDVPVLSCDCFWAHIMFANIDILATQN